MDESIAEFVKSVRIEACRVSNTPHWVFLCGGPTTDSIRAPIRSARDYFYRYIKSHAPDLRKRVRLAEEINDWFDEDTFADLLELEVYLADLSDLTILFVESPGSLAELGAFATADLLRPRTLAVLNSSHKVTRTFIADGPVRKIRKCNKNLIHYYEWNDKKPSDRSNRDVFEDMSKELVKRALGHASKKAKERTLNKKSDGHTMFLIADLIDLLGITKATEIMECLSIWNYTVDKKKLKQYLSLLEHLGSTKRKPYSDQTYYLSVSTSPLIKYDFNPGTKVRDRDRIKALIRAGLSNTDPRRMRVYQRDLRARSWTRRSHV
jgi:hypothetical protein